MRILITGLSGTKKKIFAEKLKNYSLEKIGIKLSTNNSSEQDPGVLDVARKKFACFEVEDDKWLSTDFMTFLTDYDEKTQLEIWSKSLQSINRAIDENAPEVCLLLIHASCYRNGRFFSPICWDDILLFKPDCVITLIDDLYDLWQRIEDGPHDTHLSLNEILTWRSVEISNSRTIAQNLKLNPTKLGISSVPKKLKTYFSEEPLPHYVMSVKHPLETFHRLIFGRDKSPLVYASFPITRTRKSKERIDDINSFRTQLHDAGAIVIDPLTIDEMRMEAEDPKWLQLRDPDQFQAYQRERWAINDPVIDPPTYIKNPFQNLSDEQIKQVARGIEQHVVDRDFRLVAQCSTLVAYRPFYPEKGKEKIDEPSLTSTGGVTREINYALGLRKKVYMFHPRCDWKKEQESNFFDQLAVWGRTHRYPMKTSIPNLPETDSSGFDELLKSLIK